MLYVNFYIADGILLYADQRGCIYDRTDRHEWTPETIERLIWELMPRRRPRYASVWSGRYTYSQHPQFWLLCRKPTEVLTCDSYDRCVFKGPLPEAVSVMTGYVMMLVGQS